ncbi:MAG: hypothetical protein ACYC9S_12460 [Leptospirales bacterium]
MITLSVRNPDDGTASYNDIKVYSSSTQTGTYTLLATVAIDLTQATEFSTGYTVYTDTAGTTSTWYEFSYYNSTSTAESPLSTAIQGGTAYLDTRIRQELQDYDTTAPNYPFWTNDEIAAARQDAVNFLYPFYFKDWVDTSLVTVQNSWTYALPAGLFDVEKIQIWDQTQTPYTLIDTFDDFDITASSIRLHLSSDVNIASGYTMYIFAKKRIQDSADVPGYLDEMLISKACAVLIRKLIWDRSKYQRYTTIIRPEGGNIPSLMQMLKYYEAVVAARKQETKKGIPARDMKLT